MTEDGSPVPGEPFQPPVVPARDSDRLEFVEREVVGVDAAVRALNAVVVDLFKANHNRVADA